MIKRNKKHFERVLHFSLIALIMVITFMLLIYIASTKEIENADALAEPMVVEAATPAPEPVEVVDPIEEMGITDEEIELLALVTMAEAEGEPVEGQRLVISTILNRVDSEYFPNTLHDVIYQKGQFTSMWNGRADRCVVTDEMRQLVREELINRTNSEILYFRANYYHSFGTPVTAVGNHYFSTR